MFTARGVQPVTYSGTWEIKKKPKSDEPSRMVVLGLARSEKTFRAAERVMNIISNVALGVTPKLMGDPLTLNMIPPIHRNWWLETIWGVVGRLNAGHPEHDVVSWWLSANSVEGQAQTHGRGNTSAFVLRFVHDGHLIMIGFPLGGSRVAWG